MHKSECRGGIDRRCGVDARDAIGVEADVHRTGQPGDAGLLGTWRQGQPEDAGDNSSHHQQDDAQAGQQATEIAEKTAHSGKVTGWCGKGK